MKDAQPRITRLEDYRRPDFLLDSTELHFELGENETRVRARLALRRNPLGTPGAPLVLDGQGLALRVLAIDGRALARGDFACDGDTLRIEHVPDRFALESEVTIEPHKNTALEGLYRSQGMFCTQCEAEGFRRITYYLDRPDALAQFTTTIVAERARYPVLLSNGNAVASGELDDGRHWVRWHDPFPKPCYLFALVAGNLVSLDDRFITQSGREVALRIFVEAKDLDKCEFAMQSLKQAMRWDEEVYGREYDLDVFNIVAVDDFNMGAMENKSLNIFNTSCVLANPSITTDAGFQRIAGIVAHEYFHNWSGNRVTCRDWFQLSLKEGFTVFRDAEFSADTGSRAVKRIEDVSVLRTSQFAEDAGPLAHPVRPESYIEINNFYTLTVYEKGAEVVRMIRELIGAETFRRGTDLYFARHDGHAVTVEDFVRAMEEASGRDLGQFRLWYSQAGTPRLVVSGSYDSAARRYRLAVTQSCPPTPGQQHKKPMHIPLRVGLVGASGELVLGTAADGSALRERVVELREAVETIEFEDIAEAPVPSLLRGFSAPVRLSFPYTRDELALLMRHDSDGFARWDAGQTLATEVLQARVANKAFDECVADPALVHGFRALLADREADPAMIAQMLHLPAESYLAELAESIDPLAIHRARRAERSALAGELRGELLECYYRHEQHAAYAAEQQQIARRSLRNACLGYLLLLDAPECRTLAEAQYRAQHNMTDVLSALASLVHNGAPGADALLADFHARWRHEGLAMNLWFQLQAQRPAADTLADVERLYTHASFDPHNPNKVRALLGAFAGANAPGFHRLDHAGYRFLGQRVAEIDARNPQLAARLLAPLTRWRRYASVHAEGMRAALTQLRALPALSPDCFEVVGKSLAEPEH